jgi:disulfide bond formation protein DsbB
MININDSNEIYKTALQLRDGEVDRLFQRVNFFLIGTAFLIAALVSLVIAKNFADSEPLVVFAYLLTSVGLGLSILFTISNYVNDRTIRKLWDMIQDIEAGNVPHPGVVTNLMEKAENDKLGIFSFVSEFSGSCWSASGNPFAVAGGSLKISVPHSWAIPFSFTFFWIISSAMVSFEKGYWLAGWIIIGAVILIMFHVILIGIYSTKKATSLKTNE